MKNPADPLMMARLALALLDRLEAVPPPQAPDDADGSVDDGAAGGLDVVAAAAARRDDGRVVLVSSARAGEGKSFVAGLLQAALSAQPPYAGRVALIASDRLSGQPAPGERPLSDGGALLFQPAAVRRALAALRRQHALVVVDGGTLNDCGALAREADAVLLVVDASRTPRRSVDRALAAARIDPARLAGVVLNRREAGLPRWLGAD